MLALLAVMGTLAAQDAAGAARRVLLQPLARHDVSADEARRVEEALAEALGQRADVRLVTVREIDALVGLQREGGLLDCQDQACVAELSRAAGAPWVLAGSLGRVGERTVLTLRLVDVLRNAAGASEALVGAGAAQVVAELGVALEALFGAGGARSRYQLPRGERLSCAVFDLEPTGVAPEVAQNLTQLLATQLKQVEGLSVISRADIASVLTLEAQRDQLDCAGEGVCLAEIGAALGVHKLVVGSVGRMAGSFVVTLRLVDVRAVRVDSRVSEVFEGPDEQLIPATRHAARRLFGLPDEVPGTLTVTAAVVGAEVLLDEAPRGLLPLPPIGPLPPGRHRLRLTAEGFEPWSGDVYVEPAAASTLWAELREVPRAWYQRWWVWAGAAALVGGGVAGVWWLQRGEPGRALTGRAPELP